MKKLFALPLAALVLAACSESTDPNAVADVTPAYAKPGTQPTGPSPATTSVAFFQFNGGIDAQAGAGIGTDTDDGTAASSAADLHYAPSNASNGFVGRFNNTNTRLILNVVNAATKYTVDFDLYIIGSWDGRGKQAQSGVFQANVFQVGYRCTPLGTVTPIFTTTFSNQYTVQQDFPLAYLTGGYKAGSGSVAGSIDALGYASRPDLSNTPTFRSFGDATYHLTYTIESVCGGAAPQFVFSSTAPGQQSNYDESWGVDNLRLLAN
jgi:hypothetical protein